jgi:putative transposase
MIVDFIHHWSDERTGLRARQLVDWLRLPRSKYYHWCEHYGQDTARTQPVPRDHWLEDWEWDAIVEFAHAHPLEGYRRLTFMMLDADVVAVSSSTTYRVLLEAGLLGRSRVKPSAKGKGFTQPLRPHEHWHIDVSYLNIAGTFYYLCSILDGYSRAIVHWEVRDAMKETDIETLLQRAVEKHPGLNPRIISDNGPQFIARDFKSFIREVGLTHVRTSPHYPQSNGKLERYHRSLKADCLRVQTPLSLEDARRTIGKWVEYYNTVRLHSAIGYIAPADKLAGKEAAIFAARDTKLETARQRRKRNRINRQHSLTAQPAFSN